MEEEAPGASIVAGLEAGTMTGEEAVQAIAQLLDDALAPFRVAYPAGYSAPTGATQKTWKRIWPPAAVWCQENGGHCPDDRTGHCKHCGSVTV